MSFPPPGKGATSKARFRQQKPGLTAKGDQRRFVKHNYTDHADEEDELGGVYGHAVVERYELSHYSEDGTEDKKTKPSPPFPLKLYMILNEIECRGQGDVVSWLPHGRAFFIRNNDFFTKQILPEYFKKCKISSFFRQLNLYGFIRLTAGFDTGAYYHEYFLRGKPFLTMNIVRTKVKGTKIRAASSPQDEPDFYSMLPLPDFPRSYPEAPMNAPLQSTSAAAIENTLQARATAASAMQGNQSIPMPQRLTTDYNQLQVAPRLSNNPLPIQPAMMSHSNPHSFAHIANDQTSVAAMFDSPRLLETMRNHPMSDDAIRSRIRDSSTSIMSDPNFYNNPLYPTRPTYIASDPHHYRNHLSLASNHRLHEDAFLHNMSSSLPSVPNFNQETAYPINMPLGSLRDSDLTQNIQMMMASSATEDTQQMARVIRALEMRQPPPPQSMLPAEYMPSNLMQAHLPQSSQRRPRSLSEIINLYLDNQSSQP